jgi:hypothetical protein
VTPGPLKGKDALKIFEGARMYDGERECGSIIFGNVTKDREKQ